MPPLFYRKLQQALQRVLGQSDQDYSAQLFPSREEQEELQWWLGHLSAWNGRTIMTEKPSLVIESDASTRGWGASCEGIQTGGPWSPEEKQWHINCLEALAAFSCSEMLCQGQEKHHSSTQNGQHHSSGICEQSGGNSVSQTEHHSEGAMALVHEPRHHSGGRTPPGILNTIADEESQVM